MDTKIRFADGEKEFSFVFPSNRNIIAVRKTIAVEYSDEYEKQNAIMRSFLVGAGDVDFNDAHSADCVQALSDFFTTATPTSKS